MFLKSGYVVKPFTNTKSNKKRKAQAVQENLEMAIESQAIKLSQSSTDSELGKSFLIFTSRICQFRLPPSEILENILIIAKIVTTKTKRNRPTAENLTNPFNIELKKEKKRRASKRINKNSQKAFDKRRVFFIR